MSSAAAAQHSGDALWLSTWHESRGEATIRGRQVPKAIKLFCGWFCPFAQRAWIACEAKQIDYQYVEINPYEVDTGEPGGYTKRALPLDVKRQRYPEFVACSPRGLVPAVDVGGERVWDSLQVVEYIDEKFRDAGAVKLMPDDPLERARVRIWITHCADQIQKHYYTLLMVQEPSLRDDAKAKMFDGCRTLARAMAASGGPFFLGARFSAFEIALAPFWQRYLWVGSEYRGLVFPEAEDDCDFARLQTWWAAVERHPAVAATLVCRERLISSYSDYATNKGTSEYAKIIQGSMGATGNRTGTAAHATQAQDAGSERASTEQRPAPRRSILLGVLMLGVFLGAAAARARGSKQRA